jgi:hypothetical protein
MRNKTERGDTTHLPAFVENLPCRSQIFLLYRNLKGPIGDLGALCLDLALCIILGPLIKGQIEPGVSKASNMQRRASNVVGGAKEPMC